MSKENQYTFNPKVQRDRKPLASTKKATEIRMRNLSPDTSKALISIGAFLNKRTVPDTLDSMIHRFMDDQTKMKQLQARNSDLHNRIGVYVEREAEMIALVREFITQTDRFNKMTTGEANKILKKFRGTKKSTGGRGPVRPGSKIVPRKKAAGKRKAAGKKKLKQGRLL